MSGTLDLAQASTAAGQHKYHFSLIGYVREMLFQNKAIISFKLNGLEERGLLLAKMFHVGGKPLEEVMTAKQTMADFIKINETIEFDCHIYDKGGGVGTGKDKCNYYIMKACKQGDIWVSTNQSSSSAVAAPSSSLPTSVSTILPQRSGTGWVSEISDLHGVLTYTYNGIDQRLSFKANRLFLFGKRLGLENSLTVLLQLGEQLQFEAVGEMGNSTNIIDFCPMSALIVYKGKRPQVDLQQLESTSSTAHGKLHK